MQHLLNVTTSKKQQSNLVFPLALFESKSKISQFTPGENLFRISRNKTTREPLSQTSRHQVLSLKNLFTTQNASNSYRESGRRGGIPKKNKADEPSAFS